MLLLNINSLNIINGSIWSNLFPLREKKINNSNFSLSSEKLLNIQQSENRIYFYIKLNRRHCTILIQWASTTQTTVTEDQITMEMHC